MFTDISKLLNVWANAGPIGFGCYQKIRRLYHFLSYYSLMINWRRHLDNSRTSPGSFYSSNSTSTPETWKLRMTFPNITGNSPNYHSMSMALLFLIMLLSWPGPSPGELKAGLQLCAPRPSSYQFLLVRDIDLALFTRLEQEEDIFRCFKVIITNRTHQQAVACKQASCNTEHLRNCIGGVKNGCYMLSHAN